MATTGMNSRKVLDVFLSDKYHLRLSTYIKSNIAKLCIVSSSFSVHNADHNSGASSGSTVDDRNAASENCIQR